MNAWLGEEETINLEPRASEEILKSLDRGKHAFFIGCSGWKSLCHPGGEAQLQPMKKDLELQGIPILASVLPLKSASMTRFINRNMPGILVPEALIEEMENATDRVKVAMGISARIVQELRGLCQGIHLIPAGWERKLPTLLDAAKL